MRRTTHFADLPLPFAGRNAHPHHTTGRMLYFTRFAHTCGNACGTLRTHRADGSLPVRVCDGDAGLDSCRGIGIAQA